MCAGTHWPYAIKLAFHSSQLEVLAVFDADAAVAAVGAVDVGAGVAGFGGDAAAYAACLFG